MVSFLAGRPFNVVNSQKIVKKNIINAGNTKSNNSWFLWSKNKKKLSWSPLINCHSVFHHRDMEQDLKSMEVKTKEMELLHNEVYTMLKVSLHHKRATPYVQNQNRESFYHTHTHNTRNNLCSALLTMLMFCVAV